MLDVLLLVEVGLKIGTEVVHGREVGILALDKDLLVALEQAIWSRWQNKGAQNRLPEKGWHLDHVPIREEVANKRAQAGLG